MNSILGKWGAWILFFQVLFGGAIYWMMVYHDAGDIAFKSALVAAWAVVVIIVLRAVYADDMLLLALSLSSLAAVLATLCAEFFGPPAFVGTLVLMCLASAFLAARLAGPLEGESTFFRFLGALPVLGGLMYLTGFLSGDYRNRTKEE